MEFFNNKNQKGYVALMSVIIICLILLAIVSVLAMTNFFSRSNVSDREYKRISMGLAESCANVALLNLASDFSYNPVNEIVPVGALNCTIDGIVNGAVATTSKTIKTSGSFNNAFSNMEVQATVQDPVVSPIIGATLTVVTHVINDDDGTLSAPDFIMNITASNPFPATFPGVESGEVVLVDAGGYSITGVGHAGYTVSNSPDCSGSVLVGKNKTCVFTYDDIPTTARVTLIVNIMNDNGGTTTNPGDFSIFFDGVARIPGQPFNVAPGTYNASNTAKTGYTASLWGYHCAGNGSITVAAGDKKTCIVTYDDNPPPTPVCAETVMMLDRSLSMFGDPPFYNNHPEWIADEKTAAKSLVDLYSTVVPNPKIGAGRFGDNSGHNADIFSQLSTNYSALKASIDSSLANVFSFTNLNSAINIGNAELNGPNHVPGKEKVLILVSDGVPTEPSGSMSFNTGFNSPSTDVQNAVGDFWNSASGAYATGGGDATATVSSGGRQRYYNFNFPTIASGATITGIQAQVDAWATANPVTSNTLPLLPTASGNYYQWTPNTGSALSAVDDVTADNDTSYIDVSSMVHTFAFANSAVPAGATINSVTLNAVARGTASGTTMQLVAENGGTPNISSTNILTTSYANYSRQMTTNPLTGAAWTLSEVNNWTTKFGVRATNGSTVRVTQLYVTVDYAASGDTNYISPSANSADSGGDGNGFESNPANAYADGSGYASNINGVGDRHRFYNYNFNLPAGAIITGIVVRPDWWVEDTARNNSVNIELSWNGGSNWTSAKIQDDESTSDQNNKTVGGSTDTWGRTWALSDFTTSNFRVRITSNCSGGWFGSSCSNRDFYLDWIPVEVYYDLSGTTLPLLPNASGNYEQWTPNTGNDVNSVNANDGDTSYIDISSMVHTFTFQNSAIPSGATINSVTISAVARGTASGTAIQLVVENGGAPNAGSNINLTTSYATYSRQMTANPFTGSAWTLSEVNNWTTKFGVRAVNGSTVRVTQLYIVVNYTITGSGTACQLGMDLSWNGGTSWTSEKTVTLTGTEASYLLGSVSDDWTSSHTWQGSEFTNANFRARVHAIDPGAACQDAAIDHLDWLQMKVYYNQTTNPTEAAYSAADAAKISGTNIFTIHFGDPAGRDLLAKLASGNTPNPPHQNGSAYDLSGSPIPGSSGYKGSAVSIAPNQFSNPDSAFLSDNIYATNTTNGNTQRYGNFGFNIPPNSTITGIQVTTEAKVSGSGSAQTTPTLYPNGQGTYTSWTGDEGDIDENGSPNCGSSDGNENISESTTNDRESVDIDLSGVPNGATITSVDVIVSYRDGDSSGANGTFQTFTRLDGTNQNSNVNLVGSNSTCSSNTQTINVPDTVKGGGTTLEIGVIKTANDTSEVWVGSIRTVISYITSGTGSLGISLSSDNGTSWTSPKSVNLTSSETITSPSGNSSSDLWSRSWNLSDFADGKFALRVQNNLANGNTVSLDQVRVNIYYSLDIPENGPDDNFYISPTSADMKDIFEAIGRAVCPAVSHPIPAAPPTTANLVVINYVINDNGGTSTAPDFTMNVTAASSTPPTFPGFGLPGTTVIIDPSTSGAYSVDEDNVPGYTKTIGVGCSSAILGDIHAGETRTCTIVNDDKPPAPVLPTPPAPVPNVTIESWVENP